MIQREPNEDDLLSVSPQMLERAFNKAFQEAVLKRARLGLNCSTVRDGQVVWLSPEEIFRTYHALPAELRAFDPRLLPPPPGKADSNLA